MPGKVASLFQPQGEAEVAETGETVGVGNRSGQLGFSMCLFLTGGGVCEV